MTLPVMSVLYVSSLQASKSPITFPFQEGANASEKIAFGVKLQNVFERETLD